MKNDIIYYTYVIMILKFQIDYLVNTNDKMNLFINTVFIFNIKILSNNCCFYYFITLLHNSEILVIFRLKLY